MTKRDAVILFLKTLSDDEVRADFALQTKAQQIIQIKAFLQVRKTELTTEQDTYPTWVADRSAIVEAEIDALQQVHDSF